MAGSSQQFLRIAIEKDYFEASIPIFTSPSADIGPCLTRSSEEAYR